MGFPSLNHTKVKTQRVSNQFTSMINDAHTLTAGFEYTTENIISADRKRNNTSLYIQDEWKLADQWKLTGGLRYDNMTQYGSHYSPSINLGYEFSPDTNMYASYSHFFIAPTTGQLYGFGGSTELKPEKGYTTEIGINHRFDSTFVASANMFWRNAKDRIAWVWTGPGAWDGINQNVDAEKANGWSLQFRKRFDPSVNAFVGYTHTHIDPIGTGTKNTNGYIPRGAWNIGVDYSKDKLDVSLLGRGAVDRPGPVSNNGPAFPSSNYWVWDLGFNYKVTPQAKLFVKANNIFNQYYAEHTNVAWGAPEQWYAMPGRNFTAGMQYTF
jgi:vitamin B12 transporter